MACARGSGSGPGGAAPGFAITYPDAPPTGASVNVGERFNARPAGRCFYDNGREARWTMSAARVIRGELPPGLTIEDGAIGGVPTARGSYRATIELTNVTCAGTSYPGQTVDVHITVK